MWRQYLQPKRVYSRHVPHENALAVDDLGVDEVRWPGDGVQNTTGVNLERNVAPDGPIVSGHVQVGGVGEQPGYYTFQYNLLVTAAADGDVESFQRFQQL